MTERQATEIFNQENKFIENFGKENVEVLVTYYKALKPTVKNNPIQYYKVVTRTCKANEDYYNTEMGKASLARGNQKQNMPGTTGNLHSDRGNEVSGAYSSKKGERYRFYPDINVEDKVWYYDITGKRIDEKEVEDLVNKGIISSDSLRKKSNSKYIGLYLETIANIVVRHIPSGKEAIADSSVPKYVE